MKSTTPRPPMFALLFMSMFGVIGIIVLVSLWTADGFGEPPLFFKLFGSCIALSFIIFGFGAPLSMLKNGRASKAGITSQPKSGRVTSYDCPSCGANVEGADVSPSGDIKCSYCNQWWNIHR